MNAANISQGGITSVKSHRQLAGMNEPVMSKAMSTEMDDEPLDPSDGEQEHQASNNHAVLDLLAVCGNAQEPPKTASHFDQRVADPARLASQRRPQTSMNAQEPLSDNDIRI